MLPHRWLLAGLAAMLGIGVGRGAWTVTQPQVLATNSIHAVAEAATPASPKPPTVRLMLYASPVWVVAPGAVEKSEAVNGQEIAVGTKVITAENTRAAIVYPNGTTTVLDFNSEATLKDFQSSPQKVMVELNKNQIWSRVVKLIGEESYQTESFDVVATVRGTSYGHSLLPKGGNKIITREGLVVGNCKEKKQNGEVPKGFKTQLNCGDDTTVMSKAIEAKDKDEWYSFNEEEDNIDALLRDKAALEQVLAGDPSPTPVPQGGDTAGAGVVQASQPVTNQNTSGTFVPSPTPRPRIASGGATPSPAVALARTPTPTPSPVPLPPGEVFVDSVVSVSGTYGHCCGDLASGTGDAQSMVTGGPNASPDNMNFIQLSNNAVITLRFANNRVVDRAGADLRIYTYDQEFPQSARVEVGAGPDCGSTNYKNVGNFMDSGNINIDIAGTGLSSVQCVRITDLVDANDQYPDLGFDLDAAEAIHSEEIR